MGGDHPNTLNTMNNLGVLYCNQGNYIKAEEYYVKCYEGRLRALGEDHPDTLSSMNILGNLYESLGL